NVCYPDSCDGASHGDECQDTPCCLRESCADSNGDPDNDTCLSGYCDDEDLNCFPSYCKDGDSGDCSGADCPKCNFETCSADSECFSGVCGEDEYNAPDERCLPFHCGDGDLNGTESDTDCGGSCTPCGNGDTCNSGEDCLSGDCDEQGNGSGVFKCDGNSP
ncbi:MAG: hypothetical protein ACOCV2_15820, partial [Persicimonas sp.]